MHYILAKNARINILFVHLWLNIYNQPTLRDLVNAQFYPVPSILENKCVFVIIE
jgi:hypothetical protein